MLNLRDKIKGHVRYEIGNGREISVWYDKWCENGPLCDKISRRDIYDARLSDDMKIADLCNNGGWKWPNGWEEKFSFLKTINKPIMHESRIDSVKWSTNKNTLVHFSTNQVWKDLREDWAEVEWKQVIWFSHMVPRHAFILWLAVQGKLMTQDKMLIWQHNVEYLCALCKGGGDSHEHLFFQCDYAKKVWKCITELTPMIRGSMKMMDVIGLLAAKKVQNNISVVVCKFMLAAAVYYIWQERNLRIFKKKERSEDVLCSLIKENVRRKMLSLRINKSKSVDIVAGRWNMMWKNNELKAISE